MVDKQLKHAHFGAHFVGLNNIEDFNQLSEQALSRDDFELSVWYEVQFSDAKKLFYFNKTSALSAIQKYELSVDALVVMRDFSKAEGKYLVELCLNCEEETPELESFELKKAAHLAWLQRGYIEKMYLDNLLVDLDSGNFEGAVHAAESIIKHVHSESIPGIYALGLFAKQSGAAAQYQRYLSQVRELSLPAANRLEQVKEGFDAFLTWFNASDQ
jgi:hypothetical protein